MTLVVMPDTITAVRSYLLTVDELAEVGNRIYYGALPAEPIFPAVRISEIDSTEDVRPAWGRTLLQVDVWHSDGRFRDCRGLAATLAAALVASTNTVADGYVLGGPDNVTGVSFAPFANGWDDTWKPPRPRYVVTAGLLIRPN